MSKDDVSCVGSKRCLVLSSMLLCSVEVGLGLVQTEQIDFWFGVRRIGRQNASL